MGSVHLRQPKRTWIAASLVAAVVLVALLSLCSLSGGPVLGAKLSPTEDGTQRLLWVMPGGHLYEAGLRPGDVVRPAPAPIGSQAWGGVEIVQGDRSGVVLPLTRRWPPAIEYLLFCLGLEFLAAGLWVFLRASDRLAANHFTILSTAAAATFIAFPAIGNGHPWALILEWIASKVAMAAFVLFFLTTPVERWRPLRWFFVGAPVPILSLYGFSVLARPDLYSAVKPLGYSYMAMGLATSLLAMAWPIVTRAPRVHRRMWPVLLAATVAVALYLFGSVLPYLLFRRYLLPPEVAIAGVGLIPIGFVWAMLHYPLLGMSVGPWAVMKTVFDTISDAIFVVGANGRLVDASRAGLALLRLARVRDAKVELERLMARLEVAGSKGNATGASPLRRVLAGEVVDDEELQLCLPNGETAWMSVAGMPLFDERGRLEMGLLVYRDISERKRREVAQRELERQKDEFFANISHDLKTPISAIKSSVGVVLANEPANMPEQLHRMLVNIDLSANKMVSLVEDLLELARLQAGRIQLAASPCSLRELARHSAAAIEPLAAARGQRIELDLPSDPTVALVDAQRIERALANLLANAHQYGRPGGTIHLGLKRRNGDALFVVADDGPGIPEAEQERVFDRFYRTVSAAKAVDGTGLGLPIARAMVELHNGRLWVESKPGAGAAFWIALPVCPMDSDGSKDR